MLSFPDLTSEGAFPLGGCVCGVLLAAGASPLTAIAVRPAGRLCRRLLHGLHPSALPHPHAARRHPDDDDALQHQPAHHGQVQPVGVRLAHRVRLGAVRAAGLPGQQDRRRRPDRARRASCCSTCSSRPRRARRCAPSAPIPTWPKRRASMSGPRPSAASAWPARSRRTSGALMVQSQGFADVNMGLGILINGLAALMIGEAIVGKQTVLRQLAGALRRRDRLLPAGVALPCRRHAAAGPEARHRPVRARHAGVAEPASRSRGPAPARETFANNRGLSIS